MPKRSLPRINFNFPRFTQISESHCGPATLQMLLSYLNIDITQEAVSEAGGATELIDLNGMRIDQLALAVRKLAPHTQFWYKDHSEIKEVTTLVLKYHYPVGVEWQGVFDDPEEDGKDDSPETGDEDYGHYSVVTHVHPRKRQLIIADPYKNLILQARIFSFEEFEERWYDFNEVPDLLTGQSRLVEDYHMMFIVTPADEVFPFKLGMKRYEDEISPGPIPS